MKKVLGIALLFIFGLSMGQIRFEKGYFITNSGTKTECLIKNMDWVNSPDQITYKLTADSERNTISTLELSELNIENGPKYIRAEVDIDKSSNKKDLRISSNPGFEYVSESLFLKVLLEGKYNLYFYKTSDLQRFFYSSESEPITQLNYKIYEKNNKVHENNNFRIQISKLFNVGLGEDEELKNLEYRQNLLVNYFEKHAQSENTTTTYSVNDQNVKKAINITPKVGYRIGKFSSNSYYSDKLIEGNTYEISTNNISFGVEVEYVFPFNRNKWSAFATPTYHSLKQSEDVEYKSSYSYLGNSVELKYSTLELPIGVRHHMYINKNIKAFLNVAYSLNINLDSSFSLHELNKTEVFEVSSGGNLSFGGGISIHKFVVDFNYNLNRTVMKNYVSWDSEFSSIAFSLGYQF